jgi:hypothetical protein
MRALLTAVLLTFAAPSYAGLFDDIEDLEGKAILYAGEFETLSCPIGGKYDCLTWPRNLMRTKRKGICFSTSLYSCSHSCKGFIAAGNDSQTTVYIFESGLGNDLKKGSFERYKCPDRF